ncbi:MAG: uroporphyrinogen-III synthase [Simkania negevensis]|nr:uroporphyrinogen-III synthase [Simkania negevensis]
MGLGPPTLKRNQEIVHHPLIEIKARDLTSLEIQSSFAEIPYYTHILFTSKSSAELFAKGMKHYGFSKEDLEGKEIFAVGKKTSLTLETLLLLEKRGIAMNRVAEEETQEGLVKMLLPLNLEGSYFFLPCSSLSRKAIQRFFSYRRIRHQICFLYDTEIKKEVVKVDLNLFEELIFTSPSTVEAFKKIYGEIPKDKKITAIGPITNYKIKF